MSTLMLQDNKEPSGVNQFSNVPIEQIKRLMEGINFGSLIKSSQRAIMKIQNLVGTTDFFKI